MANTKETVDTSPEGRTHPQGYTVLARRYRPQTFTEIIGQEAVARALTNALKSNRVAHAYLFTGSRGVGKTSTARILAKALNCVEGPTATPCGTCSLCQSIATGEDLDVLEIDGASNRRIDEIRDIRSNVQYRPSRARYKIYIIDEVHMLTKEAFNALLKTLEEPPAHVKFIFATTEIDKVPITILSRCQRFDFTGIPLPRIVERLQGIVAKEGLQAEDEALELVARRAGGSMRDAQSLLDQLLAFGEDKLTAEQVHHLLGTAGDDRVLGFVEAILAHEPARALEMLDEATVTGLQLGELLDQLIAYWRDLMVVHCAGEEARDLSVPTRLRETLARHAQQQPLDTILAGLDILAATKTRLRGSNHGRTLVEMALVRLARLQDLVSIPQLTQLLDMVRVAGERGGGGGPAQQRGPARSTPPTQNLRSGSAVQAGPQTMVKPGGSPERSKGPHRLNPGNLAEAWPQVVANMRPLVARVVQGVGLPAISEPNTLVFEIGAIYNQTSSLWNDKEWTSQLTDEIRKLTDQQWVLQVKGDRPPGGPTRTEAPPPPKPRRNAREEAEKQPMIRRAIDVLGAVVQRVDEGFGEEPAENASSGPAEEATRDSRQGEEGKPDV